MFRQAQPDGFRLQFPQAWFSSSPSHLAVVGERYHAFLFQATQPDHWQLCAVILVEKVLTDINAKSLKADALFEELIKGSSVIEMDEGIYAKAKKRVEVGNPPGKNGSLGDALNWEALLNAVSDGEDIYFISDDKDFTSPLNQNAFNSFLLEEWCKNKHSKVKFYKSLSTFLRDYFPDISLADESEKDNLIQQLAHSTSFTGTHLIISNLMQYSDFSSVQTNGIIEAYLSNNQVYKIIHDADIEKFIENVISGKEDQIDSLKLQQIYGFFI